MTNLKKCHQSVEAESLEAAVNNIKINKERVFSIISFTPNSPVYSSIIREYEYAERLFFEKSKLVYSYMLEEEELLGCSHIAFGGVTLGEDISACISELFDNNEYSRALILNALSDDYIMQAAEMLENHMKIYCENNGVNVVKRYDPYSEISPQWIKRIADKLTALCLRVNDEFCITPEKTLLTLFSADRCIKGNIRSGCTGCSKVCKWRKN